MRLDISYEQLRKWHRDRVPAADVCRALGWSVQMYRSRMRAALGMPDADDPTPAQIKKICESISREWTDAEREQRRTSGGSAYQKLRTTARAGERSRQTLPTDSNG